MKHWRETLTMGTLAALLAVLASCGPSEKQDAKDASQGVPALERPLKVVTTHPVVHEAVVKVSGDRIDSVCLRRAEDQRGTFDLHAGDVERIAEADIVFVIGAGHERGMLDTVTAHAKKVVRLAEDRDAVALRGAANPTDDADECWVSPLVLRQFVVQIDRELSALDPANATHFAQAGGGFRQELTGLLAWIDSAVKSGQRGAMVTNDSLAAELGKACWMPVIQVELDAAKPVREADRAMVDGAVLTVKASVIAIDAGDQQALAEMLGEVAKARGAKVVTPAIALPAAGQSYLEWIKLSVAKLTGAAPK